MAKVSKTKIDAIIKSKKSEIQKLPVRISDEKVIEITVNPNITYEAFVNAVKEYEAWLFSIDGKTKEQTFMPWLEPLIQWLVALKYYTDVDARLADESGQVDWKQVERLWALAHYVREDNDSGMTLREEIDALISRSFSEVCETATEMVYERRQRARSGFSALSESLTGLTEQVKEVIAQMTPEDVKEVLGKLADATQGFSADNVVQFPKEVAAD